MFAPGLDEKEKLAHQKQLLNRRLGLDTTGRFGLSGEDLFAEEDLVLKRAASPATSSPSQVGLHCLVLHCGCDHEFGSSWI